MSKPIEPYKCAFSISNEILVSAADIAFKLGRLSLTHQHEADEDDFALATRSTLALEGIVIKPGQSRSLYRGDDIPSLPLVNAVRKLYEKMPRIDPYDAAFKTEFENTVWPEGVPTRLSRKVASFPYPIPMHAKVESLIKGLYSFANGGKGKIHPLTLACLFYFELLAIQPYSELNGLFARYMLKAFIGSYSPNLFCLPLERLMLVHKDELDQAFADAVAIADTAPFVTCMMKLINEGVDALLRRSVKNAPAQSPLVAKLMARMEPGRYYSCVELLRLLGLKSRISLQKNYIKPGLEAKVIEMSNPVCPTDRTQRYRKL
ncbi:MAG: Fic family protein [Bacilli bacterium]|nr:Fic family protein [Bacilli bacterium]